MNYCQSDRPASCSRLSRSQLKRNHLWRRRTRRSRKKLAPLPTKHLDGFPRRSTWPSQQLKEKLAKRRIPVASQRIAVDHARNDANVRRNAAEHLSVKRRNGSAEETRCVAPPFSLRRGIRKTIYPPSFFFRITDRGGGAFSRIRSVAFETPGDLACY